MAEEMSASQNFENLFVSNTRHSDEFCDPEFL
jgi:hypothetical protein